MPVATGAGGCNQTNFTDKTAYRFGVDRRPMASAPWQPAPPPCRSPIIRASMVPASRIASGLDPSMRPNDVDTFNFSIQRQVNRKMLVEVGYIGRLIHHEYMQLNPNVVPYMMSMVVSRSSRLTWRWKRPSAAPLQPACAPTARTPQAPSTSPPQPFFESALGGASSAYCTGYSSCTAAVVAKQASNLRAQKVFSLWQALDNNVNGASGAALFSPAA